MKINQGVLKLCTDICLLHKSILHWQTDVKKLHIEPTKDNCPLCGEYYEADCRGCPIAANSKGEGCHNTPIDGWGDASYAYKSASSHEEKGRTKQALKDLNKVCDAEIEFLSRILSDKISELFQEFNYTIGYKSFEPLQELLNERAKKSIDSERRRHIEALQPFLTSLRDEMEKEMSRVALDVNERIDKLKNIRNLMHDISTAVDVNTQRLDALIEAFGTDLKSKSYYEDIQAAHKVIQRLKNDYCTFSERLRQLEMRVEINEKK
jgi:hypothetical protein